jgi:NAD(P)-dependent dehydrogenase (short-subunit alcohol dehydrogenase family)
MTAIALITGASGGIGRALARQLQAQRCRVAALDGGFTTVRPLVK